MKTISKVLALLSLLFLSVEVRAEKAEYAAPSSGVNALELSKDVKELEKLGYHFYRVEGKSMLPYYDNHAVVGTKDVPLEKLRPGMLVVYFDGEDLVAHRVEKLLEGKIIMKGHNNKHLDPGTVTKENYKGVIAVTLHANSDLSKANNAISALEVVMAKNYD
jgi:hypothetical protein